MCFFMYTLETLIIDNLHRHLWSHRCLIDIYVAGIKNCMLKMMHIQVLVIVNAFIITKLRISRNLLIIICNYKILFNLYKLYLSYHISCNLVIEVTVMFYSFLRLVRVTSTMISTLISLISLKVLTKEVIICCSIWFTLSEIHAYEYK